MDGDELNNWGHPPAATPVVQQNDAFSFMNLVNDGSTGGFSNARSVGPDQAFFLLNPSPATPLPWRQMHSAFQPYPYAPSDTTNNLMVDLNQPPNFPDPLHDPNYMNVVGNVPNLYLQQYPFSQRENRGGAVDNVMNVSPQFSSFRNPGFDSNSSIVRGNAPEIIDLTTEDDNSDFGKTYGPRVSNNSRGPGVGNPVLCHSRLTGGTGSVRQDQLNAIQFENFRRVDGNFLSPGNEYKPNDVPKFDLAKRVTAGDQVRGVSSSLNLSHTQAESHVDTIPNLGGFSGFQNSVGGFSGFQNNVDGLPSSQNSMDRFSSTRNYASGFNAYINNAPSMSSAGYLSNLKPSYVQRPQTNKEHCFPKSSNSNIGFMPYANSDPYTSLRDRLTTPARPLGNSSAGFHHPTQAGLSSAAPSSADFPRTVAQPTLDQYPKLFQGSVRNNLAGNISSTQYVGSPTSQVYPGQVIPTSINTVAQAGKESTQILSRSSNPLAGRTTSSSENYGHLRAFDVRSLPPRKRSLIHPDPSLGREQRRRMTLQYPSSPYISSRPQGSPAGSVHVPASRAGSGAVPNPSGYKCMLCKRDLAFAPDGPIHNPSVPPGVAVLPCQHTFHDHCLQRITPDDQAKNPPCIPCAMSEK